MVAGREGPSVAWRGAGGGGWARCHRLSLPPGNPPFLPAWERKDWLGSRKQEEEGDPGGEEVGNGGGRLGGLASGLPEGGARGGPGRLGPAPLPSKHIFIHSFNKHTFIGSGLCQALGWGRGCRGRR